jgi:hypothetical protein
MNAAAAAALPVPGEEARATAAIPSRPGTFVGAGRDGWQSRRFGHA